MSIASLFKRSKIDQGVKLFKETPGAILVDVRSPWEYRESHIPGSINIPLPHIYEAEYSAGSDTPIFLYCRSGARSQQAAEELKCMGYMNVRDIGGIISYTGEMVS